MKHIQLFFTLILLLSLSAACGAPADAGETAPDAGNSNEDQGEPFLSVPGVADIKLLTDVDGAGEKPLFKWEAVTGAARYHLILYDEAGEPYWAWEGTSTQIYIGGVPFEPSADSSGPSIEAGYSWAVVAYDADGNVLAASKIKPISP